MLLCQTELERAEVFRSACEPVPFSPPPSNTLLMEAGQRAGCALFLQISSLWMCLIGTEKAWFYEREPTTVCACVRTSVCVRACVHEARVSLPVSYLHKGNGRYV